MVSTLKGVGRMGLVGQVKNDMALDVEGVSKCSGRPVFSLFY